jgi:hypothetical protein
LKKAEAVTGLWKNKSHPTLFTATKKITKTNRGAAFAATYNALLQGGSTAKKQLALRRLQDKAGTKTTEAPAPAVSMKVHVMLPQQGWQMPPMASTRRCSQRQKQLQKHKKTMYKNTH